MGTNDWSDEHVRRFWDWFGTNAALRDLYFSYLALDHILNILSSIDVLRGKSLDYGCGGGHLVEAMLERGLQCAAIDFSSESRKQVNEKHAAEKAWLGAVSPDDALPRFAANAFDLVTCIEVIEHLRDDQLATTIGNIHNLLKPGGTVFISTPHAENLERSMILCPFCESVFSRVQHLRSFTEGSLAKVLDAHGFDVVICRGI